MTSASKFLKFKPIPLTIERIANFVKLAREDTLTYGDQMATYLAGELPVRLAHMTNSLMQLPEGLRKQSSMKQLIESGRSSMDRLEQANKALQSETVEGKIRQTTAACMYIIEAQKDSTSLISHAMQTLRESVGGIDNFLLTDEYQEGLGRYFTIRFGVDMLAEQQVAMFQQFVGDSALAETYQQEGYSSAKMPGNTNVSPTRLGIFDERCSIGGIARNAHMDAALLCDLHFGRVPDVRILVNPRAGRSSKEDVCITYIPQQLYFIFFELLKNAMRAVVENAESTSATADLPPIKVIVVKGEHDVAIKVSDEGGGIPRKHMPHLFSYSYSTAKLEPAVSPFARGPVMAGFGFGLPLSRCLARYFGGDLSLISMEGYGTDALVHLKVVPSDAGEVFVQSPNN